MQRFGAVLNSYKLINKQVTAVSVCDLPDNMRKVPSDCIFISCHKPCFIPEDAMLYPVQVGAELSVQRIEGMQPDNEGDNISVRNPDYCELTAQYWAWKNADCDHYGFFHYRRFMAFDSIWNALELDSSHLPAPYIELDNTWDDLSAYKLDSASMREVIHRFDILTVLREHINETVYEQYAEYHDAAKLNLALDILKREHPEYSAAADRYMSSHDIYYMNMFIMSRRFFQEYMEWLFDILTRLEQELEGTEHEPRLMGFIAERLFGIYYTKKLGQGVSCAELRYIKFYNTDPDAEPVRTETRQYRIGPVRLSVDIRSLNRLFPAGSRRRQWLRGIFVRRKK